MSKVKIQGHASGTGVLTVTAPNTSTDRTITLPDSTGTILDNTSTLDATKLSGNLPAISGASLTGLPNGSQLDHSGSKKIEATSTGVDVIGVAVTDGITSSGNITFDNGNSSVSIKSDGANGSYIQFGSNEYLRFLYDNGASESIRLIDGGGITFNGDTAAANALNDYEEGTWTPTFAGATISAANTTGHYTKIGRQVFYSYYSGSMSISSSGGTAKVNSLPFTASTATEAYGLFNYKHGTAIQNTEGGYIQNGTTDSYFTENGSTASVSWVNGTKHLMVAGTYFIN
jgi:hypothetical protein